MNGLFFQILLLENQFSLVYDSLISISLTLFGVDLAVNSAVHISKELEIPDSFIGLSLIAIGTSLPELVTSISAAKRGNNQIIFGNIIGSNIYNLLLY